MRIRDKIITATCRTKDGIEWTSRKLKKDGNESVLNDALPTPVSDEPSETMPLPDALAENLKGDITVALRTSELLMRTMEFPTADAGEIADMVGFQIDKISPFPIDQLAVAHEIVKQGEDRAWVLMAAAKRECVDAIGDAFQNKGVHIHSIDARVLGWLQLLRDDGHLTASGCEILLIDDQLDLSLTILFDGMPIAFRSLPEQLNDMNVVDDLAYEISYTLATLDTEHNLPEATAIHFWSNDPVPAALRTKLAEKTGLEILHSDLGELPPLSEGIIRRTLMADSRIEFIPSEWIEHQKRKKLIRRFSRISAGIAAVWVVTLLVFIGIYKTRTHQLEKVQARADAIAPAAKQAKENQEQLRRLTAFTDRSDSALECLREITRMLPPSDIEFVSYNYKKGKGVTLRGTAAADDTVYSFFKTLTDSGLFTGLKNQSVNTKTTKGVRRSVFSATLELPVEEQNQ